MKRIIFLLGILGMILLVGCANDGMVDVSNNTNNTGDSVECNSDSDCVAASCCHSSSCVPKEEAPDCEEVFCTEECREGTMDCGQGECRCVEGECEAVMKKDYISGENQSNST